MADEARHDTPHADLVAALIALAQYGIPSDIQELLVSGDPMRGIRPGALAAALSSLQSKVEELERERDEAIKAFDKFAEPRVKSFQLQDGQFDLSLTGPAVEHIAAAVVGHFKAMGARNYFELNLFDRDEPFQRYVVTVQKVNAQSPHELRKEAESRALAAEAKVERMAEALREIKNPIAAMRKRAEAEGGRLDGMMAQHLAKDPHYPQQIAARALAEVKP